MTGLRAAEQLLVSGPISCLCEVEMARRQLIIAKAERIDSTLVSRSTPRSYRCGLCYDACQK